MGEPRIVYCGMFGPLSRLPLAMLLERGAAVQAVVVPATVPGVAVQVLLPPPDWSATPRSLADLLQRTIVDLAWERGLPVLAVADLHEAATAALAAFAPDLIAVSCFPHYVPAQLRELPSLGVLNLHPTLLPRGRGADPLFWLFREPDPQRSGLGGVTVHRLSGRLDAGPVLGQTAVTLPDGVSGAEAELRLAAAGATLLADTVAALVAGTVQPQPQDEALATLLPMPMAADYVLTPAYPARWLFNCVRGIAGRGVPVQLLVEGDRWLVQAATGYDPAATLATSITVIDDLLQVRCQPGVLFLRAIAYPDQE